MGSTIAKSLAQKGQKVFVYDINFAKVKALARLKNITADKNFENLKKADFKILAVKPYHLANAASELGDAVEDLGAKS